MAPPLSNKIKQSFLFIALMAVLFFILPDNSAYAAPLPMGSVMTQDENPREKKKFKCQNKIIKKNQLVTWLYKAGFRGHNIREAWAIAMRESSGIPSTVSGEDYGLFQFNYGAWGASSWWDSNKLLDPLYNAKIAYKMSKGGKSWIPWGMKDHMEWDTASYAGIWSSDQFYAWVIEPYTRWYSQYPCK